MPPRRACLWDYVSVMYRDHRQPPDPREWPLTNRWLISPRVALRAARSGGWRRLPRSARLRLTLGATLYTAAVLALVAIIPFGLTGLALLSDLDDGRLFWVRIAAALLVLATLGLPIGWSVWIASGGADRATAIPRRRRTRLLRTPDADAGAPELAARRTYWRAEIAGWPGGPFYKQQRWIDPAFAALLSAFAGGVAVTAFLFLHLNDIRLIVAAYAVIFTMFYWGRQRRKALQRRLLDALDARACPNCAYPFAGLRGRPADDEIPTWPGPPRCPECGAPWPALPPPVPQQR